MSGIARNVGSALAAIVVAASALVATPTGPAAADSPIPVGRTPRGIALNTDSTFAYVANANGDSVSVINTATDAVIDSVRVASNPYFLAVDPNGPQVYVPGFASNAVSVINTTTNTATQITDASFQNPTGAAVNPLPSRGFAYIVNYSFGNALGSVTLIDTETNTVTASVPVGKEPRYVAVTPDGNRAYVSNSGDNTVSVLDLTTSPPTVTDTLTGFSDSAGLAVTPDGTHVYVTNIGDDTVTVVRTSDNATVGTINMGSGASPMQVAFTPNGSIAYVTNPGLGTVAVIDTATGTVTQTQAGFSTPWGIAIAGNAEFGYITQESNDSVARFEKPTITGLSPTVGPTTGGTPVTITGSDLASAFSVQFGATSLPSFTVLDDSHITLDTPAGPPGPVDVTVTTMGLSDTTTFTYFVPVEVIAGNASMTQGGTVPPIGHSAVQVGTSTHVALTSAPTCRAYTNGSYTTEVSPTTGPGTYVTHCTGGSAPANHTIQDYTDGTLTVLGATPTPTPTVSPTPTPTPTPTPAPTPPVGVKASATAKAVTASWKPSSGATGYVAKLTGKSPKNKKVVKTKKTSTTKVKFKVKLKKKSPFKVCITASNSTGPSTAVCRKGKVK